MSPRFVLLVLCLAVALALFAVQPAPAGSPTISTTFGSSGTCGGPEDVCTPSADVFSNSPAVPATILPGALGLVPGDEVSSLTVGLDGVVSSEVIRFSVDAFSAGAIGAPPDVASEAAGGEAQSDIFFGGTVALPGPNLVDIDGDGFTVVPPGSYAGFGLVEPASDDIDALTTCDLGSLVGSMVWFTLAPGSPTLGALAATPADILMTTIGGGPIFVFATALFNGLGPGDVIDALVFDGGAFYFSLAPGSPGLIAAGAGPEDILVGGPALVLPGGALGLAPGDNLNALDIAPDVDFDATNDFCDNCPGLTNNDQLDSDGDGAGDLCDPCPLDPSDFCVCPAAPAGGCKAPTLPGKALLLLKDKADDAKDGLKWKWAKGPIVDPADWGDPVSGSTSYRLCAWDESAGGATTSLAFSASVPPGGTCKGGKPCWKSITNGFKFKDPDLTNDGIKVMVLKGNPAVAGKAKIVMVGKGAALPYPGAMLPLTQDVTTTVQLANSDGFCWEAEYSTNIKNDPELFKAKSD